MARRCRSMSIIKASLDQGIGNVYALELEYNCCDGRWERARGRGIVMLACDGL
jgi:hypothetical protein